MPRIAIADVDDPRIAVYRNLHRTNLTRWSGQFIVEGPKLVRRLAESPFPIVSLLVGRRWADEFAPLAPADVPVYEIDDALIEPVIGFNFHRGVLGCGKRIAPPPLESLAARSGVLAVCPELVDPDNLGAIARTASALAIDALVLGPGSADAFSRRALRVSMGAVLAIPIVESRDLDAELDRCRQLGYELVATVTDPAAQPLATAQLPPRVAILLGNEAHGLAEHWIERCQRRVTIPMPPGIDSLNVAVAAGIFLYQATQAVRAAR